MALAKGFVLLAVLGLAELVAGKLIKGDLHTAESSLTDIYLGNFIFDARGGSVSVSSKAGVGGQRFLFFDESKGSWSQVLAMYTELSCEELSKLSLLVTEDARDGSITEGLAVRKGTYAAELQIAPTPYPKRWYTMLSNCEDKIHITFEFTYLNPGGFWYQQFSVDEQGLVQLFLFFTVMYSFLFGLFGKLLYQLYTQQTVHILVMILALAISMEFMYVLLEAIHGLAYANNGVGLEAFQAVGEVCDAGSNIAVMALLILLAKGWTTQATQEKIPQQWLTSVAAGLTGFFGLYVLERVSREMDHKFCYDSGIGAFALLIRASLCVYFLWCLKQSYTDETMLHRRVFLKHFGFAAAVWFLCLPLIWLLAQAAVNYWRMRIVLIISLTVHAVALGALAWLIWPKKQGTGEYVTITAEDMLSGVAVYDDI